MKQLDVYFNIIYSSRVCMYVCVCVWMVGQLMENVTSHRSSISVISPRKMRLIEMTAAHPNFHFYFPPQN